MDDFVTQILWNYNVTYLKEYNYLSFHKLLILPQESYFSDKAFYDMDTHFHLLINCYFLIMRFFSVII